MNTLYIYISTLVLLFIKSYFPKWVYWVKKYVSFTIITCWRNYFKEVEYLPSKRKALSSNPSTKKRCFIWKGHDSVVQHLPSMCKSLGRLFIYKENKNSAFKKYIAIFAAYTHAIRVCEGLFPSRFSSTGCFVSYYFVKKVMKLRSFTCLLESAFLLYLLCIFLLVLGIAVIKTY
jgi:hypothetical protein